MERVSSHEAIWEWDEEDQFWFDSNQPDSDQFGGTVEEWVAVLESDGFIIPVGPPVITIIRELP